jgi:hypothetical protein
MKITGKYYHRLSIVVYLVIGLIFAPYMPGIVLAADEGGAGVAGPGSVQQPTGTAGGAAAGVGVSGPSEKTAPEGRGVLAPPQETAPATQPAPVKGTEPEAVPKGIGASAGTAGTAGTSSGGGLSPGFKVGLSVLGLGVLVGVAAAAGGGGSSGGGGTTPTH